MKEKLRSGRLHVLAASGLCAAVVAAGASMASAQGESLVAHMHEHYDSIRQIQSAVIRGDLAATREPAKYLAEHPTPAALPAQWSEHVKAMREAARATLAATDVMAAGSATAMLGTSCGGCHAANGIEVEFESTSPPGYDTDKTSHMVRHQWAADRMWEGIIGPSEPAWSQGIDVLFEAPLTHDELGGDDPESVKQMARRIHQLAGNGMMAGTPGEKAGIYGEFIGTCAKCHTALKEGPGQ